MNAEFKEWIIQAHDRMTGATRTHFLQTLKFSPNKAATIIGARLLYWAELSGFQMEIPNGPQPIINDANEVLLAFTDHFKKELDAIPNRG